MKVIIASEVASDQGDMIRAPVPMSRMVALEFAQHLVVAILVLNATPRSQILRLLGVLPQATSTAGISSTSCVPQTLVREADHYQIRISADGSKNRQPVLLRVNDLLTKPIDFYLSTARRSMVADSVPDTGVMFPASNGGRRTSFTQWVHTVTIRTIGRAVNPHSFRSACVSLYYDNVADEHADRDMLVLSQLMSHDKATAARYYFKSKRTNESKRVNDEITAMLGVQEEEELSP